MTDALVVLLQLDSLLILSLGTLLVMFTSFIPGMSGVGFASIALAITATWSTEHTMILFGAITGGATFMGSVTAILFNVPGSASSSVALLDGYVITSQGRPKMAISIAALSSALGSLVGVTFTLMSLPYLVLLVSHVGAFELTLLLILGLFLVLLLPSKSLFASLTALLSGLLCAGVGADILTGGPRLNFGVSSLYDGLAILPLMLGVFTLPEVAKWFKPVVFKPDYVVKEGKGDSVSAGLLTVFRHIPLVVKSSLLGTVVGAIPGLGGPVAGYAAYGLASAKRFVEPRFGQGQVRGLIAPEAAIDAKDGGMLIPTLSLGIPGSEACVILLAALAVHGLQPGVDMLTRHLTTTYLLIFALVFSNLLTSFLGILAAPSLARIRQIPLLKIAPWILLTTIVSAGAYAGGMPGIAQLVGFYMLGLLFRSAHIPIVPFVVAFILGDMIERNGMLAAQLIYYDRVTETQLISAGVLAFCVIALAFLYRWRRDMGELHVQGNDLATGATRFSMLALAIVLILVAGIAFWQNLPKGWSALYFSVVSLAAFIQGLRILLYVRPYNLIRVAINTLPEFSVMVAKVQSGGAALMFALLAVLVLQPLVGLSMALATTFGAWFFLVRNRSSVEGSPAAQISRLTRAIILALFLGFVLEQTSFPVYDPSLNDGLFG